MQRQLFKILIIALFGCQGALARADELTLAVASNFTPAMEKIIADFEEQSGHDVTISYGSSGRIFAQIINGAPYDLFFSADQEKPRTLIEQEMAVPGSQFTYAIGTLVLWSANPDLRLDQGEVLQTDSYRKLAIANPRLAPYGKAAVETLDSLGFTENTRPRWVQGENIAQAFQFVSTGNAELGFVALSQLLALADSEQLNFWQVPAGLHAPIRQDAVVLNRSGHLPAAQDFLEYLKSPAAKSIIEAYGYQVP